MIFSCPVTWKIWCHIFNWWTITTVLHSSAVVNMESWNSLAQNKFWGEGWLTLFFNIVWSIWYIRNEVWFNGKSFILSNCVESIKNWLGYWILYYCPNFPCSSQMVASNIKAICSWNPKKSYMLCSRRPFSLKHIHKQLGFLVSSVLICIVLDLVLFHFQLEILAPWIQDLHWWCLTLPNWLSIELLLRLMFVSCVIVQFKFPSNFLLLFVIRIVGMVFPPLWPCWHSCSLLGLVS